VFLFYVSQYTLGFFRPKRLLTVVVWSLGIGVLDLVIDFECASSVQVVKSFALATLLQILAQLKNRVEATFFVFYFSALLKLSSVFLIVCKKV